MSSNAQFGGIQAEEKIGADGLDLFSVGAPLVELKQLLCPAAAVPHIHHIIHHQVITAKYMVPLIKADVSQFLILVGILVQCLLYQLPGKHIRRVLVIPTVSQVNVGFTPGGNRIPFSNVPGSGAEGIRHRQPLAAGVGNIHLLTELGQGLLLHQKIAQGEIEELAQHMFLIASRCTDEILHIKYVIHSDLLCMNGIITFG